MPKISAWKRENTENKSFNVVVRQNKSWQFFVQGIFLISFEKAFHRVTTPTTLNERREIYLLTSVHYGAILLSL